jgi:hypothetical protein
VRDTTHNVIDRQIGRDPRLPDDDYDPITGGLARPEVRVSIGWTRRFVVSTARCA